MPVPGNHSPRLLAGLLILASGTAPATDLPDPEWRHGPVRYILSVEEDAAFRQLTTDTERAAFIEEFWKRLDPTPDAGINERRDAFWRRTAEAIALFGEGLTPGWKTDRGKVHILMGPADQRTRHGPSEVWVYEIAPRAGQPLHTRIEFRRNTSGEYNMPRDALKYHDPLAEPDGVPVGTTFLAAPGREGSARMVKGRIRMAEFPLPDVTAEYFAAPLEAAQRYDFHRAEDGGTHAILTIAIPPSQPGFPGDPSEPPDFVLLGTLADPDKGAPVANFSAAERVDVGDPATGRPWLFRSATTVPPGTYRASITAFDRHSHRGTAGDDIIEVPDFERRFALSTIAVGHEPPLPLAPPEGGRPGGVALRAEPASTFREGESVFFAYQVYNARHRRKQANLEVRYSFSVLLDGEARPLGNPIILTDVTGESLTYELPLRGWPAAEYILSVEVLDTLGKEAARGEARFTILATEE
jgi:GWxTD domain-containing protein